MQVRTGNLQQDSVDFRDQFYNPDPIPLPNEVLPHSSHIQILDQGQQGSCTGFGLAGVINYLNFREGRTKAVSSRMLYEMAKRHDQWPGEGYDGSSCRGAIKGWSKYGVCLESDWEYNANDAGFLTRQRIMEARRNPCGLYYRLRKEVSAIRTALAICGVVYASATVHEGWGIDNSQSEIDYDPSKPRKGGHAFAIVGYTADGFIVQNSWGDKWGQHHTSDKKMKKGLALWSTQDLLDNGNDFWVVQVGLPIWGKNTPPRLGIAGQPRSFARGKAPRSIDIDGQYIHIDDGYFDGVGNYPSYPEEVQNRIEEDLTSLNAVDGGGHLFLYAHGGLNDVKGAAQRISNWDPTLKANNIHQIHFLWETGLFAELKDVVFGHDKPERPKAGGFWDDLIDSATDITDGWIEKATQKLGHKVWHEMILDAEVAFQKQKLANNKDAAGKRVVQWIINSLQTKPNITVHLVGHSAGSIWHGNLLDCWKRLQGPTIENLFLMAPACTHDLFTKKIKPHVRRQMVKNLHHFLLTDEREKDDQCFGLYRKSLLYLVSRSFQSKQGGPIPLMGMQKDFPLDLNGIKKYYKQYLSGINAQTNSSSHGGFDNDLNTMNTILKLILGPNVQRLFTKQELK